MGCIRDDFSQSVCLTLVYNIYTGALISSTVENNECELSTEFDSESKNLTIRVPFTVEGILRINDHFQANYMTSNIFLTDNHPPNEQTTTENPLESVNRTETNTVAADNNRPHERRVKTKRSSRSKK